MIAILKKVNNTVCEDVLFVSLEAAKLLSANPPEIPYYSVFQRIYVICSLMEKASKWMESVKLILIGTPAERDVA